jgi:hypothetical protein
MLRRTLFGGLTIMLAAVLVWLIIQGRREEAKIAATPGEVYQTSQSSATRVIAPKDLEVVSLRSDGSSPSSGQSLGSVEIRNRGALAYHNVMLQFSYRGPREKLLEIQTQLAPGTIEPGRTFNAGRISVENAPAGSIRCDVSILYSELGPAPNQGP